MNIRKRAVLAATIVAVAASACSSNSEEDGGEAPSTTHAKSASDFSRTVDLGGGYSLSLDIPAAAGVVELADKYKEGGAEAGGNDGKVYILTLEGQDLSSKTREELLKMQRDPDPALKMTTLTTNRTPCLSFDTWRNGEDTIDATSPLNGQPVSYQPVFTQMSPELKGRTFTHKGTDVPLDDIRGSAYSLRLGGTPCVALTATIMWFKGAPASPLPDLAYQVFVEGDGVLTSPS